MIIRVAPPAPGDPRGHASRRISIRFFILLSLARKAAASASRTTGGASQPPSRTPKSYHETTPEASQVDRHAPFDGGAAGVGAAGAFCAGLLKKLKNWSKNDSLGSVTRAGDEKGDPLQASRGMAGGAARRTPSFEMRSRRSASLAAATSSSAARNASRVALAKTSPDHPTRSIVGALGRTGGGGGGFGQRVVPYASPLHAGTDTSLARCFLPNENTGDAFDGGPDADAASTSSLWAAKATAAPATATTPITVPGSMSTAPSGRIWLRTGLGRVYEDALKAPSKPSLKCNIFQRHPVRGTTLEAEQDRTRILPTRLRVLCGFEEP